MHPMFYTSHESLHLPYETALTRFDEGYWFNRSTHFPWVGYRTNEVEGAHVEYVRGLANPIALKIGPDMCPHHLAQLVNRLNPQNEPGRLTLIHRLGAMRIQQQLPALLIAVAATKKTVLWSCDPMHGNTRLKVDGKKTRYLSDVCNEIKWAYALHQEFKSSLNGIHIEVTAEGVDECIDDLSLAENSASMRYTSLLDPRLNAEQALLLCNLIATQMEKNNVKIC